MKTLFLVAGVAALAIAAPASAQKGGHGGGGGNDKGGGPPAAAPGGGGGHGHGGGGGGAAPAYVGGGGGGRGHGGGGGGGFAMPSFNGGGHGHGGGGFAAPQQRVERQRGPQMRVERQQARQQSRGFERQQARNVQHQQARGFERQQARNVQHQQARGFERQQARNVEHQQARGFERQQARNVERQNGKALAREHGRIDTQQAFANQVNPQQFERGNGKIAKSADRQVAANLATPYRTLTYGNDVQIVPVQQVQQFVGVPVAQVPSFLNLSPLPATMQYLYPATADYYYQYGNGYLYQIDQGSNLIAALIPRLAGGYLPGQYVPNYYMSSYVPDYYGFNSFYPDYGDVCNRYYDGVIYQVDCDDGYVENVIPMYAGGYGVGQLLPSAYSYYNVPMQYRTMYYDTPNYGYWYAPGAIYQYDNRSSLITSVAALLSPGFTIGQQLPLGYDVYNVPYDYRATYYDTPNAWYRYNNGYIYQVDPATQVVTAIVASLLT